LLSSHNPPHLCLKVVHRIGQHRSLYCLKVSTTIQTLASALDFALKGHPVIRNNGKI
jgi:hypothetical protein